MITSVNQLGLHLSFDAQSNSMRHLYSHFTDKKSKVEEVKSLAWDLKLDNLTQSFWISVFNSTFVYCVPLSSKQVVLTILSRHS